MNREHGPGFPMESVKKESARAKLIRERRDQLATELEAVLQEFEERQVSVMERQKDADLEDVRIDYSGTIRHAQALIQDVMNLREPMEGLLKRLESLTKSFPRRKELLEQGLKIVQLEAREE